MTKAFWAFPMKYGKCEHLNPTSRILLLRPDPDPHHSFVQQLSCATLLYLVTQLSGLSQNVLVPSFQNFTTMYRYCVLQLSCLCYILPRYPGMQFSGLSYNTTWPFPALKTLLQYNVLCFSHVLPLLHLTSFCGFLDSATVQRAPF